MRNVEKQFNFRTVTVTRKNIIELIITFQVDL